MKQFEKDFFEHQNILNSVPSYKENKIKNLHNKKYQIIYSDPPWKYRQGKSMGTNFQGAADAQYKCMNYKEICKLPIKEIADKDCILFLWATFPMLKEALTVIEAWGFCTEKSTRILKADLTWEKASNLKVGDRLLSFNENYLKNDRRYYEWSTVESNGIEKRNCYKITLENGKELISSYDHEWLCRYRQPCGQTSVVKWIETQDLLHTYNGRKKSKVEIIKLANIVDFENNYESRFIASGFDAEGSLNKIKPRISFCQNNNSYYKKMKECLNKFSIKYGVHNHGDRKSDTNNTLSIDIQNGFIGLLDFLQKFRPPRLLNKWSNHNFKNLSVYNTKGETVKKVEFIGKKEVATLQTSSRTYIAEGYASHNTYKTVAYTWLKINKNNKAMFFGIGYYTKSNAEICLLGTKGNAHSLVKDNSVSQVIVTERTRHSQKPNEARKRIIKLVGDLPRIELFARGNKKIEDGWIKVGNEISGNDIRIDLDKIIKGEYL